MSRYRVSWTDTAKADLLAIVEFIAADSSANALQVLDRLELRAASLEEHPDRGRLVPELQAIDVSHYRELIEKPWRLNYRVSGRRVLVLAVLDGRRDLQSLLLERLVRND